MHTVERDTGQILESRHTTTAMPDGVLYVPCGDRRASRCPPCAETYRADTYQLIKAGIVGGKGVPETGNGIRPWWVIVRVCAKQDRIRCRVVAHHIRRTTYRRDTRNPSRNPHGG